MVRNILVVAAMLGCAADAFALESVGNESLDKGKIKATWDVGDYVQDGLVIHYDGIRNIGASEPHDFSGDTWADIAPGSTRKATRVITNENAPGEWTATGYRFARGSYFQTPTCPSLGLEFTIQMVSGVTLPDSVGNLLLRGRGDFRCANVDATETKAGWTPKNYSGVNPGTLNPWHGLYWNGAFDAEKIYETEGTTWEGGIAPLARTSFTSYDDPDFTIGGAKNYYFLVGDIHAVRMYTRKLTNGELARNRLVDEIRFRGRVVTNVVVAADVRGIEGDERPGVYAVDGRYVFTATTVADGKSVYEVTGYTLETWDAAKGAWSAPVAYSGGSYACENDWASDAAPVRLTWKWTRTKALLTAADFSLEDYVSDGLVASYDGICNAGIGKPHDPTATKWADVSGNGKDTSVLSVKTSGREGHWTDNAYHFDGGSQWNTPYVTDSLGLEFTIQLATSVEIPATANQLLLRGAKNLQCGLVYSGESNTHFFSDGLAGVKPGSLGPWAGDYWNCAMDAESVYEAHGTDWEAAKGAVKLARTAFTAYDNPDFSIGGHKSYYLSTGDIHALRIYSRKLTNAELVQNRAADEARFHGRLMVTNVLVAANGRGLEGAEPPDAYTVKGGWTFTAAPVVREVDGRTVTYTPVGYTLETLVGGVWSAPVAHAGSSYAYDEGDGVIRLRWKWHSDDGLLMILR